MEISLTCDTVSGASGYKLEAGRQSAEYSIVQDIGPFTTGSINIIPNGAWYLAAIAYNGDRDSLPSNEIRIEFQGWGTPAITKGPGVINLEIASKPETDVMIFSTEDFLNWNVIGNGRTDSAQLLWTDVDAFNHRLRFYRAAIISE